MLKKWMMTKFSPTKMSEAKRKSLVVLNECSQTSLH